MTYWSEFIAIAIGLACFVIGIVCGRLYRWRDVEEQEAHIAEDWQAVGDAYDKASALTEIIDRMHSLLRVTATNGPTASQMWLTLAMAAAVDATLRGKSRVDLPPCPKCGGTTRATYPKGKEMPMVFLCEKCPWSVGRAGDSQA